MSETEYIYAAWSLENTGTLNKDWIKGLIVESVREVLEGADELDLDPESLTAGIEGDLYVIKMPLKPSHNSCPSAK